MSGTKEKKISKNRERNRESTTTEARPSFTSVLYALARKYWRLDKYEGLETARKIYVHYCPKCRIVIAFTHRPIEHRERATISSVPRRCPFCNSELILNHVISPRIKLLKELKEGLEDVVDKLYEINKRLHEKYEDYDGELREVIDNLRRLVLLLDECIKN